MNFCTNCDNLMYPSENKEEKTLQFRCKSCGRIEVPDYVSAETNCVFTNDLKLNTSAKEIDPCMIHDPTYPRTKKFKCSRCQHNEAIFFQSSSDVSNAMTVTFVCCNVLRGEYCGNYWNN